MPMIAQSEVLFVRKRTYFCRLTKKCFLCTMNQMRPILTITGSDPTSGSGVQADIHTISALGGRAVSAITSVTVQTSLGIQEFYDLPAHIVERQIEAVMNDMQPEVVKIGMVRRLDVLDVIVRALTKYHPRHIIYDPVVMSSLGEQIVPMEVHEEIVRRLLPICTIVDVRQLGEEVRQPSVHGLANRYSSAVAVFLGRGESKTEALRLAREYIHTQIVRATDTQGRSSDLYKKFLDTLDVHVLTNSDVHFYAENLNVSTRYLAQVTKRMCGRSPKAIIEERLIHEIELQLNTTDKTVQEVAYSCGFSSQAHFTKFFKKMKGISPTQFRKS